MTENEMSIKYYYQFNLPTLLKAHEDDSMPFIITESPCWMTVELQNVPMDATSSNLSGDITHQDWGGLTLHEPLTSKRSSPLQQINRVL